MTTFVLNKITIKEKNSDHEVGANLTKQTGQFRELCVEWRPAWEIKAISIFCDCETINFMNLINLMNLSFMEVKRFFDFSKKVPDIHTG